MNKEVVKEMFSRRRILPLIFFVVAIGVMRWINSGELPQDSEPVVYTITGKSMGTTYDIRYVASKEYKIKEGVDSVLSRFEGLLSNWIVTSEISQLNRQDSLSSFSKELEVLLKASQVVSEETYGAFDPTVGPLISRWGFAEKERKKNPTNEELDSLLNFVGLEKLRIDYTGRIITKPSGVELNLSAIAKGYGCDVVADYLNYLGLLNYKIEIGGEIVCKGKKPTGDSWKIAIETPLEGVRELHSAVILNDCAMATSGNYRNYFEIDGVKYAHTINPTTGLPVQHEILSASVIADNCMIADAYATAFMVMGLEKTKEFCNSRNDLEVFLIYELEDGNQGTWSTEGMKNRIVE